MQLILHSFLGFILRLVFIIFGIVQDNFFEVKYTDIDYKVFTDAARHIINRDSPYKTHTYRYPPIIALVMIPNLYLHPVIGKIIFSLIDIFIYVLIYKILRLDGHNSSSSNKYSLFWLYNPLSIIISTRGNADSVAAFLVILTLFMFKRGQIFWVGIIHGIAIHTRLYPLVFSLPLYAAVRDSHSHRLLNYVFPNRSRLILVSSCLMSISVLTGICYFLYGYDFLHESLLYHLKRQDIRHNYSVYFYLNYLQYGFETATFYKALTTLPPMILLLGLVYNYGTAKHLPFCEMCMAFVLVMYNTVVTCQYFIWYLSLLPLSLPMISCSLKELFLVSNFWFASQASWLLPAYLLEFKSQDTFVYIWFQCLVFFWANVVVITSLIRNYNKKEQKKAL